MSQFFFFSIQGKVAQARAIKHNGKVETCCPFGPVAGALVFLGNTDQPRFTIIFSLFQLRERFVWMEWDPKQSVAAAAVYE